MNFDYSDDQKFLKGEVRRVLQAACCTDRVRAIRSERPARASNTPRRRMLF